MSKIKIFLEGDADVNYIISYLNHLGHQINKNDVIDLDGKDNLVHKTTDLKKFTDSGFMNLVIFDADNDFNVRKRELKEFMKEHDVKFEYFLFPNDKDQGELENLLCDLINPSHLPIFTCFDAYEVCISTANVLYRSPNLKHKIYSYHYSLENFKSQTKIDFSKTDHWDLNHIALVPLKSFLSKYL